MAPWQMAARPACAGRRVLLLVLMLGGMPACCGLKSMASESESKHKVRATLEAAMNSFEVQLAKGEFKAGDEEYALAQALLERGKDTFIDFVVAKTFPRTDAACSWDWSSMQCEPCGQCRRAHIGELVSALPTAQNESRWCLVRAANERISGQTCGAPVLGATHGGMMVGLTAGVVGKRLQRAVMKFVEHELVAPTNSSCYFDFLKMRCEPSAMCNTDYKSGDMTPGQTCRLIPPEVRAVASTSNAPAWSGTGGASSCRWNRAQWRCEQPGACHAEVWSWVRRGLRRRTWIVLRVTSASTVALLTTGRALLKALRLQARAAGQRAKAVAVALAEDSLLLFRRFQRSARQLSRNPAALRQAFYVTMHKCTSCLSTVYSTTLGPTLKPAIEVSAGIFRHICSKISTVAMEKHANALTMMRSTKHSAKTAKPIASAKILLASAMDALTKKVYQVRRAAYSLHCFTDLYSGVKREPEDDEIGDHTLTHSQLTWAQVECTAKRVKVASIAAFHESCSRAQSAIGSAAVVVVAALRQGVSMTLESSKRWKRLLKTTYKKAVVALRTAGACPREMLPQRQTAVALSRGVAKAGSEALKCARGCSLRARDSCTSMVMSLAETFARLKLLALEKLKEIEAELNSKVKFEKADFCVAIPTENRAAVQAWQLYSPFPAKQTADLIHSKILDEIMV